MEQLVRLLEQPVCYFTKDFSRYKTIYDYTVSGQSPFFWEDDCLFVYVYAGRGRVLINQTPYAIEVGHIGILHSFHVFRFESDPDDPLKLRVLTYPYPEMVLMEFSPRRPDFEYTSSSILPFAPLDSSAREKVEALLATFQEELDHPDQITSLIRNCLFLQLSHFQQQAQRPYTAPKPPLCGEIFFYVAANSFTALTAASVAKEFSISAAHINQEIRRVCGGNFQKALNHARLSNAYSMMLRTNLSLSSVSKQAGFSSEASFYRIFQDAYQMTPQQYRSNLFQCLGGKARNSDDRLLEIESYVLKNYQTSINSESCSRELFLSVETINQILQEKYGPETNFRRFLITMRLRYAEGLLTMTSLPLYDVALDAGFNSVYTFIRLFKNTYGMTPTEYRKQEAPHA